MQARCSRARVHGPSIRAFTPVFDGLWTGVNALRDALLPAHDDFRTPGSHHEQLAGITSAHSRPIPGRAIITRTHAPASSTPCSLLWSFVAPCISDHTGMRCCAVSTVPAGGSDASEIS